MLLELTVIMKKCLTKDLMEQLLMKVKAGLARELARMNLTLNSYTQWYWKTDLLNLLNFLFLRADSHAQYEIRVYAEAMLDTVKKWVPITHAAFLDYRVGAVHVSAKGKKVIQQMAKGEKVTHESFWSYQKRME